MLTRDLQLFARKKKLWWTNQATVNLSIELMQENKENVDKFLGNSKASCFLFPLRSLHKYWYRCRLLVPILMRAILYSAFWHAQCSCRWRAPVQCLRKRALMHRSKYRYNGTSHPSQRNVVLFSRWWSIKLPSSTLLVTLRQLLKNQLPNSPHIGGTLWNLTWSNTAELCPVQTDTLSISTWN